MRVTYAIVHVSNMGRSVAFYRDALGLPLRFESPGWTEFATDGATLALHLSEPGAAGGAAPHPTAGQCRPGLGVADLDAFHNRMAERGVACTQPPTAAFGARIARYVDPDGLEISVGEERSQPPAQGR